MILDSSAIVAIFLREPGHEAIARKLGAAETVAVAAPTLVEAALVLSSRMGKDARTLLARFLQECDAEVIPFADAHWQAAVEAWLRYGKGRHRAALNFGDCISYATARLSGQPLLAVGDGFARTDLPLA